MNIFYLDRNPKKCAQYHCDQHVVKMMTEYAQILSTALYLSDSSINEHVYKPTHINHPCIKWAIKSYDNWEFLYHLADKVGEEYTRRYNKKHKSHDRLLKIPFPNGRLTFSSFSDPPQVMPELYRIEGNTVQAYRNYYKQDKRRFATWKNGAPEWWLN